MWDDSVGLLRAMCCVVMLAVVLCGCWFADVCYMSDVLGVAFESAFDLDVSIFVVFDVLCFVWCCCGVLLRVVVLSVRRVAPRCVVSVIGCARTDLRVFAFVLC